MTIKQALYEYLDTRPAGMISGWELFGAMLEATNRKTYPATLLEYCREYSDRSGARFDCVDNQKSLYYYHPGIQIAGAIID